MQGWGIAGSRSRRNHNPGNLHSGRFTALHGQVTVDEYGFAIFASDADGFEAFSLVLESQVANLALRQAIYKVAPPSDSNDYEQCVTWVSTLTGIQPYEPLTAKMFDPPRETSPA